MATLDTSRLTQALRLLAHPHRRYVLYRVTRDSKVVDISTLVAAIAKWEGGQTGNGQHTDSKAIEVGLRHSHLPKLADAGLITFGVNGDFIKHKKTDWLDQFLIETISIDGYAQEATGD